MTYVCCLQSPATVACILLIDLPPSHSLSSQTPLPHIAHNYEHLALLHSMPTLQEGELSNPRHARLTYRRVRYNVSASFLALTAISVVYLQLLQLAIPWWLISWYSSHLTNQG